MKKNKFIPYVMMAALMSAAATVSAQTAADTVSVKKSKRQRA